MVKVSGKTTCNRWSTLHLFWSHKFRQMQTSSIISNNSNLRSHFNYRINNKRKWAPQTQVLQSLTLQGTSLRLIIILLSPSPPNSSNNFHSNNSNRGVSGVRISWRRSSSCRTTYERVSRSRRTRTISATRTSLPSLIPYPHPYLISRKSLLTSLVS